MAENRKAEIFAKCQKKKSIKLLTRIYYHLNNWGHFPILLYTTKLCE